MIIWKYHQRRTIVNAQETNINLPGNLESGCNIFLALMGEDKKLIRGMFRKVIYEWFLDL